MFNSLNVTSHLLLGCALKILTYNCVNICDLFSLQNIFTEPGSLSVATVTKLRETCRERIQAKDSA